MPADVDYIKRARQRLRFTQAQLAEALGVDLRSIKRYEKEAPTRLVRLAIERLSDLEKRKRKRRGR